MTPSGIEPATFLFVAQHHKHCATAVPQVATGEILFVENKKPEKELESFKICTTACYLA